MIRYTKYSKIYLIFSSILVITSIFILAVFGLELGIDFTGGSILEIEYKTDRPSNQEIKDKLSGLNLGSFYVQPTEERGVILRMRDVSYEVRNEILLKLGKNEGKVDEIRFESIGPVIGKELREKTKIVTIFSFLAMMIYIALAFRKIQLPVKSWQYSISAFITLAHDVLIPLGIFSLLGKFYGVEISIPVITAFIAVIGYSINNTVVVFDRMRENLFKRGEVFEEVVDRSLNQTLIRQFSTSLTTLLVVLSIFFFGGVTLKYFALALILGIVLGTYSSFFIAAHILVIWLRWSQKRPVS